MPRAIPALLAATHPGPTVFVSLVTVLLGAAAGLDAGRLALLGAAMLLNQASIGWANDWLDAARDRAARRRDKPAARGDVPIALVRSAALVAAPVSIALALPLGPGAVAANAVMLLSGWAYDLRLKATPLSVAPYLTGFGALPALATLALPDPRLPAWWAVAAAALLGAAAHFTNAAPDLDEDRAAGVHGLPHRVGRRASIVLAWVALLGAAVALLAGIGATPVAGAGVAASAGLAVAGLATPLRRGTSRWAFRLVMLAALVDVGVLVLAGRAIIA